MQTSKSRAKTQLKRCDALVRKGRAHVSHGVLAKFYDPIHRRNLCGVHAQHCASPVVEGTGPSWSDDMFCSKAGHETYRAYATIDGADYCEPCAVDVRLAELRAFNASLEDAA